ncbi:Rieske 2Fe-2S domain-containing protein [uncultured Methylobacterium sp.]|uniref:Rieske 2Fe-2S domain-containing protein n=1 Tax=uncultured Methylobacterium sp. TaxID=157278 RepID=UPI0035CB7D10
MNEPPGWYAVALGADLDAGTSAGTRLFGHELVVWRDRAGAAHVWEDRCPHRGMRLSFGFVRGDHVACLYHGWRYDAAGRCRHIPAHPDLPVGPMIRATTFRSRERHGLVWVAWGDATDGAAAEDGAATPVRSLYLDAPAAHVRAELGAAPGPDGLVRARLAGLPALIAVQPLSDVQCAVHVVLDGPAPASDRIKAASACLGLRRAVEAARAEPRSAP